MENLPAAANGVKCHGKLFSPSNYTAVSTLSRTQGGAFSQLLLQSYREVKSEIDAGRVRDVAPPATLLSLMPYVQAVDLQRRFEMEEKKAEDERVRQDREMAAKLAAEEKDEAIAHDMHERELAHFRKWQREQETRAAADRELCERLREEESKREQVLVRQQRCVEWGSHGAYLADWTRNTFHLFRVFRVNRRDVRGSALEERDRELASKLQREEAMDFDRVVKSMMKAW